MYNKKQISATQLENFLSCPASFKFNSEGAESCNGIAALSIGTIFHLAIQSTKLASAMVEKSKTNWTALERSHMKELIRHAGRFPKADGYEVGLEADVDGILLKGHIDEFTLNDSLGEDDMFINITDNKTTKTKWSQEMYNNMKQKYIYSYLMYRQTGIRNIKFTYRVLPKKKLITDNDIVEFSEWIDIDEAEEMIKGWIAQYKEVLQENEFQATPSLKCMYCSYRKICPKAWKRKTKEEKEAMKIEIDFSMPGEFPDWDTGMQEKLDNNKLN